jgi:competence protein ComEA
MQSYDAFGRININTASRSELMDLPGIGSSLSERIVDYRNTHGSFRTIEDLRRVSGIGEKRFEAIMNRITVG